LPDGAAKIALKQATRDAAEKKARELKDMGRFEMEIVEVGKD
jgi:hypothetical protein